jgi:hypothetical protein
MVTSTLPLSIIGAMQRSSPHLTKLWLEWTDVPDLDACTFDLGRGSASGPATFVRLPNNCSSPEATWGKLAEIFNVPAASISTRDVYLPYTSKAHQNFWAWAVAREQQIASPVEWWWLLVQMRRHGVEQASTMLLAALGLSVSDFRDVVCHWRNPTLDSRGRLVGEVYQQPTALVLVFPVDHRQRANLAIDLSEPATMNRVMEALLTVALSR